MSLGDGHSQDAVGIGTVILGAEQLSGDVKRCRLKDVLYVPKLTFNLISVAKVTSANKRIIFKEDGCQILDGDGSVVAIGKRKQTCTCFSQ